MKNKITTVMTAIILLCAVLLTWGFFCAPRFGYRWQNAFGQYIRYDNPPPFVYTGSLVGEDGMRTDYYASRDETVTVTYGGGNAMLSMHVREWKHREADAAWRDYTVPMGEETYPFPTVLEGENLTPASGSWAGMMAKRIALSDRERFLPLRLAMLYLLTAGAAACALLRKRGRFLPVLAGVLLLAAVLYGLRAPLPGFLDGKLLLQLLEHAGIRSSIGS